MAPRTLQRAGICLLSRRKSTSIAEEAREEAKSKRARARVWNSTGGWGKVKAAWHTMGGGRGSYDKSSELARESRDYAKRPTYTLAILRVCRRAVTNFALDVWCTHLLGYDDSLYYAELAFRMYIIVREIMIYLDASNASCIDTQLCFTEIL